MLLSVEAVDSFGVATARFYAAKGLMVHMQPGGDPVCAAPDGTGDAAAATDGDTDVLAELQRRVGLPKAAVEATLAAVAASVEGVPDAFGKRVFPSAASYDAERVQRAGIWVAAVTPALHYRYGGWEGWQGGIFGHSAQRPLRLVWRRVPRARLAWVWCASCLTSLGCPLFFVSCA